MPSSSISSQSHAVHELVGELTFALGRVIDARGVAPSDREDLVQSSWLRLLERLGERDDVDDVRAFAVGIAKNLIREQRTSSARRRTLEERFVTDLRGLGQDGPLRPADDRFETLERTRWLERAWMRLNAEDRWLLERRVRAEASYAELLPRFQEVFGRPINTEEGLRTALFHARRRLRAALLDDEARCAGDALRDRRSTG
jgi:RNA polymerase sigma factor (sigma-70 family)